MATNYAHQRLDSTYSQLGEGHNGSMEFQTPPEPSILTGNKRELRWAVGSANGPRSSIWKVKAHSRAKDGQHNVYVGTKEQMHAVKLSLHEPSIWQIGCDRNYSTKRWPNEIRAPFQTFVPAPELALGWKHATVILIPTSSLTDRLSGLSLVVLRQQVKCQLH